MAQISGTFETYDAVGNREELSDKIWMITPEETPFMSLVGRKSVESVRPEWQTDKLNDIDLANNKPEGDDWDYDAITPTTRVGNYCQISDKRLIISRTQDKTSKAGRKSELAREVGKKSRELKIDMEAICLSNQASSAGSGDGASNRTLGGLRAWIATNDLMGATGVSGGFNQGTGVVDAATDGTQRAFTKDLLDQAIERQHNSGGNSTTVMLSTYNKRVFSTFMSDANVASFRYAAKKGRNAIIAAASIYESDFGELAVVPNRQMTRAGADVARNVYILDPSMAQVGMFEDIMVNKAAKTGDAEKRVLLTEFTLCVHNEEAHAVVADTFGLSAAT